MMVFELFEIELIKAFEITDKNNISYLGKNSVSGLLEFIVTLKSFTPELNASWARHFPAGSYFSISKESNSSTLSLIVTISERDYSEYFYFKQPELKKTKNGIILNLEKLRKLQEVN